MRTTRTGLAAALSAAALVGLPLLTAGPAAAMPVSPWDDPEPSGSPAPAETQGPATLSLQAFDQPAPETEVVDALETDIPPAGEDVDEVAFVVEETANDVAKPLDDRAVDLTRDQVPADSDEDSEGPSLDVPEDSSDSEDEDSEDEDSDDEAGNDASADGDPNLGADPNDDSDAQSDGSVPNNAQAGVNSAGESNRAGEGTNGTDSSSSTNATDATAGVAASTGSPVLGDTGAASTGILQVGIGLLTGGILLVGAGRHRRTGRADRAI